MMWQIWITEMSASEPSMKHRDVLNDTKTRSSSPRWDESGSYLITDPVGVRCTGGMNVTRALAENVRTYPLTLERKLRAEELWRRKVSMSSDRGGVTRSSDEALETWWSEGVALHGLGHRANYELGGAR